MDWNKILSNKQEGFKQYLLKYNIQSCIVGISGGIDSCLTCAIVSPVCKELGIPLIGRSLPTSTNESPEKEAAILVGEAFCDDFREINIEELTKKTQNFIEYFENMSLGYIPAGNIKARLRMIYLYNLAFMYGGIVLDTDNLTEHYMSFFTLHGDQGDLGVLADLWKTEIFEFANWLHDGFYMHGQFDDESELKAKAIWASLALEPTDGNGTAPDLEQYGAPSFEVVDEILQALVTGTEMPENEYVEPIKQRFLKYHFKRWHNPLNVTIDGKVTDAGGRLVL